MPYSLRLIEDVLAPEDLNPVSGLLKAIGSFGFTDADLTDTHTATVSFISASGAPAGFTVPAAGLGTLSPVVDDAGHVVNWPARRAPILHARPRR